MQIRQGLLDFIADFANWDASGVSVFLDTARKFTQAAHEAFGGAPGTKPLVVDPFAGGGAIPLETLRVGADIFASDLNPVAVLINKIVLEYIPRYGQTLAGEIEKWREWAKGEADKRLGKFYPSDSDGSLPVAYLWARTVLSEAPDSEKFPVEVPLLRTMWLSRKADRKRAIRWVRDSRGRVKTEVVNVKHEDGELRRVRRPLLEVFEPRDVSEVGPGTVRRGSATCPVTGYTTPIGRIREQLRPRHGGSSDGRLYAVVFDPPDGGSRDFRVATQEDREVVAAASGELERLSRGKTGSQAITPMEPTPIGGGHGAGRAFSQRAYGMDHFADLFNQRQLLALTTYAALCREYDSTLRLRDQELADAVNACLALIVNRLADLNASLCVWQLNTPNNAHVFGRWVLQMVWDYGEVNPLASAGGSPESALRRMIDCLDNLNDAHLCSGHVECASATAHSLPDDCAQALITDPPYYDAVPYSDLLDFFYVWMKRTLQGSNAGLVSAELGPKSEECIVDEIKGKDPVYFEETMTKCLAEGLRIVDSSGIGIVVFAHKSTSGWERLLQAIIDAGWQITGSWPIDTEMGSRLRAKESAALASSVHLVCRPRTKSARSGSEGSLGDWRDVLALLPRRINEWLPRLAGEGVVGADAIFACLGPALEIFSRYSRVEKASGEAVTLREYLEQVWAAVAKEALNMIFEGADATGFEEDARLTAMWLWTLKTGEANGDGADEEAEEDEEGGSAKGKASGFVLEYDAARKIAQGLGAHLEALNSVVEVKGETARLLPVAERTRFLFGKDDADAPGAKRKKKDPQLKLGFAADLEQAEEAGGWGQKGAPRQGNTVLDRIHQAMILFAAARGEALRRFLVEEGVGRDDRFWRLAQALSALYPTVSDERRWVDGVLARKKGLGF
jgi:adenine-specific DNA methylase